MDCVKHVYASKDDVQDRYIVAVTVAGVLRNVDMLEMIFVINCAKSIVRGRPPFSKGHIAWIRYKTSLSTPFEVLVVPTDPHAAHLPRYNVIYNFQCTILHKCSVSPRNGLFL